MNKVLLPAFLILTATNRCLEFSGIHLPFLSTYLDDLFCIPIALGVLLLIFRKYIVLNPYYSFPWFYIAGTVLLYACVFEIYLPHHSHRFTSDPLDVMAYVIGGFFFGIFMNKKSGNRNIPVAAFMKE